jgi:hypothetical protein
MANFEQMPLRFFDDFLTTFFDIAHPFSQPNEINQEIFFSSCALAAKTKASKIESLQLINSHAR